MGMVDDDDVVGGDGACADDRGCRQAGDGLGGERSGSEREDAARGATRTGDSGARHCAGSDGAAGAAGYVRTRGRGGELGEDQFLGEYQWSDREHGGERVVVLAQMLLEEAATV